MALEPVQLDDLMWTDMMSAIRARIPAASKGLWTLHAAVDPGITLLELFAWMLEQRGYWLDQAPDSLVRALLALLGETPRPVSLAGTVLTLRRDPANAIQVAGGPIVAKVADAATPLVFTSDAGLTVLPVGRLEVRAGAENLTADVEQGRAPEILRAGREQVRIVLHLAEALAGRTFSQPCSLLFELETPAKIAPEWSPGAVDGILPPAELEWLYESASGTKSFPAVDDGTAGMRRSGVVRLTMAGDWKADGAADPASGLTPYSILLRAKTQGFTSPPRLSSVAANAVVARHRHATPEQSIKVDWLPLPNNRLFLPETDLPPIEGTVAVSLRERDGQWHEWKPVSDFCFCGPEDRVFLVDRDAGWLRFGNGLTGRVPVLKSFSLISARFRPRTISWFSRLMSAAGVPAGANMPVIDDAS